ncbi:hypothetical protein MVEN_02380000 [Mycena venus]|uniref:Uncharacterized protein n=1 Tax=Mycena venus TaxID=2733690 RepID=A0A8H7CD29_9AGAR|nr:hypothetical protein MVEN_02380000 [Mycena venus]
MNSQDMGVIEDSADPYPIKVAIGPLEYCGNAHRISIGRTTVAVSCYGDPMLPEFYAERDLKSRLLPSAVHGERRPSLTAAATKELESQLGELENSRARKRAHEGDKENIHPEGPPPMKRKWLSVDKQLAMASG